MPSFKSIEELERYIAEAMGETLKKEVASIVKDEWLGMINEVVYDPFTPRVYKRRGKNDGLADPNNIKAIYNSSGKSSSITLINETKGNTDLKGSLLSPFLESIGNSPRGPLPFTDRTINYFNTKRGSDQFKGALSSGLRRNGIKAKIK